MGRRGDPDTPLTFRTGAHFSGALAPPLPFAQGQDGAGGPGDPPPPAAGGRDPREGPAETGPEAAARGRGWPPAGALLVAAVGAVLGPARPAGASAARACRAGPTGFAEPRDPLASRAAGD